LPFPFAPPPPRPLPYRTLQSLVQMLSFSQLVALPLRTAVFYLVVFFFSEKHSLPSPLKCGHQRCSTYGPPYPSLAFFLLICVVSLFPLFFFDLIVFLLFLLAVYFISQFFFSQGTSLLSDQTPPPPFFAVVFPLLLLPLLSRFSFSLAWYGTVVLFFDPLKVFPMRSSSIGRVRFPHFFHPAPTFLR